jgi:hypothetical protein
MRPFVFFRTVTGGTSVTKRWQVHVKRPVKELVLRAREATGQLAITTITADWGSISARPRLFSGSDAVQDRGFPDPGRGRSPKLTSMFSKLLCRSVLA